MNIDADSLRQSQANQVAAVRQHVAQMLIDRSDRKVAPAKNVADLLEYGHQHQARSGAAALLLDVLA